MKEVIERMLKVEEQARAIQAEAERDAARIAEKARRQANEESERLRGEAHAEAAGRLDALRRELDEQREKRLARAEEVVERYAQRVRANFPQAVEVVVKAVSGG